MAPRWLLAPLVLTLLASCATGFEDDSPDRRRDAGRGADANVGACNPPCGFGATCIAGDCVLSPGVDEDGDGVDAEVDCDDKDPDIGARAERPCEGPCGPGVERCLHGVWGECTPTSDEGCDCAPGSPPRETTCGRCGTATQLCEDGSWTVGACMGEGVCTPGDRERTTEPCGTCGQRERARLPRHLRVGSLDRVRRLRWRRWRLHPRPGRSRRPELRRLRRHPRAHAHVHRSLRLGRLDPLRRLRRRRRRVHTRRAPDRGAALLLGRKRPAPHPELRERLHVARVGQLGPLLGRRGLRSEPRGPLRLLHEAHLRTRL